MSSRQQGNNYSTCRNEGCGVRLLWQKSQNEYKEDGTPKKIPMEVDAQDRPTVRHKCQFYQKTGSSGNSSGYGSGGNRSYSNYQQQSRQQQQYGGSGGGSGGGYKSTWQCNNNCGTELYYNKQDINPRTGKGTVYEVRTKSAHKCPKWSGGGGGGTNNSNAPTPRNRGGGGGGGDDPLPFGMAVNNRRDAGAVMAEEEAWAT